MIEGIETVFPQLQGTDYRVTSARDEAYNCIAWAVGATNDWWWPIGPGRTYWPDTVPRVVTLEAFREAFATLGYDICPSDGLEPGIEKIALLANDLDVPKHAARQLPNGRWTSKLGKSEDIEHGLHDLAGSL